MEAAAKKKEGVLVQVQLPPASAPGASTKSEASEACERGSVVRILGSKQDE